MIGPSAAAAAAVAVGAGGGGIVSVLSAGLCDGGVGSGDRGAVGAIGAIGVAIVPACGSGGWGGREEDDDDVGNDDVVPDDDGGCSDGADLEGPETGIGIGVGLGFGGIDVDVCVCVCRCMGGGMSAAEEGEGEGVDDRGGDDVRADVVGDDETSDCDDVRVGGRGVEVEVEIDDEVDVDDEVDERVCADEIDAIACMVEAVEEGEDDNVDNEEKEGPVMVEREEGRE